MAGRLFLVLFVATHASLLLLIGASATRVWLVLGTYAAGTLTTLFFLFHPTNQWLVSNRSRVACPDSRPCVALTFDDGPSPETTPRILDLLRTKAVRGTFFVVGRRAEQHPELVRRMVAEGHVVGNHTFNHPPLFCFLTRWRLREEIRRTQHTLSALVGRPPTLFRSPVGLRHPFLARPLHEAGVEYISWQVRTLDTWRQDPETLRARILDRVAPGDIVLMHDRPAAGTEAMLAVLPEVIDRLKSRGYRFETP